MNPADVSVWTSVEAPPEAVWAAVADPHRLAGWSPENTGVSGIEDGPAVVGVRFSGTNQNRWWRWTTQCVVVESEPGRSFAFDVSYFGLAVARWRYAVAPEGAGSRVEEQWWDRRGPLMRILGTAGTGVADRRSHNEAGMRDTLAALKSGLEQPGH